MQDPTRLIQNNRLRCKFEKNNTVLFFSLVDYRNNLFTSNDPEKIIEFYNGFHNRDQLIQWMKERPKGASYIHEVEGPASYIRKHNSILNVWLENIFTIHLVGRNTLIEEQKIICQLSFA